MKDKVHYNLLYNEEREQKKSEFVEFENIQPNRKCSKTIENISTVSVSTSTNNNNSN